MSMVAVEVARSGTYRFIGPQEEITSSSKYFFLGALLFFLGSVLLLTFGFTVVLPYEATLLWPATLCDVTTVNYNTSLCSCDPDPSYTREAFLRNSCSSSYPCLQCSVHECADEVYNVRMTEQFKREWGHVQQRYTCYYNPQNLQQVILRKVPYSTLLHAMAWPLVSLITGGIIWLGLCLGCWKIEVEPEPDL